MDNTIETYTLYYCIVLKIVCLNITYTVQNQVYTCTNILQQHKLFTSLSEACCKLFCTSKFAFVLYNIFLCFFHSLTTSISEVNAWLISGHIETNTKLRIFNTGLFSTGVETWVLKKVDTLKINKFRNS